MPSFVVIGPQTNEKQGGGAQCAPPRPQWFQRTPGWIGLTLKLYYHCMITINRIWNIWTVLFISLEKFVSEGRAEMIDLLEIEVEIAKIINYQGSALSGVVCLARHVSVPKRCAEIAAKSSSFKGVPPYFCVMRFGVIFSRENVNLMYFVRDVMIESLVVIRYRVFLYVKPWKCYFSSVYSWNKLEALMRFLDHFCVNMLAAWLKFVAFFMSILANLGYLIFNIFWGSMPPDPPRRPRTHGKNWKYLHERWDPWTLQNPNWAPANLENMAFVALFSKLYAVPCDNWKKLK